MLEALGHYRILEAMGAGALGSLYRARDTRLGRTVLIEILRAEVASDPARREQFLRDARAAAGVSHPSLAAIYDVVEDGDRVYLVSEHVPGQPLRAVMGGQPLNPRRALEFAGQIGDALAEAHAGDVVHGNISPDAVVITPRGGAKVAHVGLQAWVGGAPGRGLGVGHVSDPKSGKADTYGLAATLVEMIAGRADAVRVGSVPPELEPILAKALDADPERRYESAAALAADLRAVAAALDDRRSTAVRPGGAPGPARRPGRAWWLLAALVVLAAVVLVWVATTR
jgi:serine/threonine protein kinase